MKIYFKKNIEKKFQFEVAVLKQRLTHHHLSKTFQSLQIPPISLDTIQDLTICQRLQGGTEKISQQTKLDMMLVYLEAAEAKMNEKRIDFDKMMTEMKNIQHSGSTARK